MYACDYSSFIKRENRGEGSVILISKRRYIIFNDLLLQLSLENCGNDTYDRQERERESKLIMQ